MTDREIYNQLIKLNSFLPDKNTNKLFSDLVKFAMNPKNVVDLSVKEQEKLREMCASAESQMESFWANKIIESKHPAQMLKKFWYYNNYLNLARLEWDSLSGCIHKNQNHDQAIFIGSGPLPLTAIILAQFFKIKFLLVDIDKEALSTSKKLIQSLKLEKYFEFSSSRFERINLKKFHIVFLAALVGQESKEKVTEKVLEKMEKGAHLLCRSVYDNRNLLYKSLNIHKLKKLPIREIRTYDDIINSVLIFKK